MSRTEPDGLYQNVARAESKHFPDTLQRAYIQADTKGFSGKFGPW